jgi:anthranilate/para-aminobenzoate synthase component I
MSKTRSNADREIAIWERVFVPDPRHLTSEQAEYLLNARLAQADLDRINELSSKASEGTLKADEEVELESYVHVGHLLSILKAKLRGRLKKNTAF